MAVDIGLALTVCKKMEIFDSKQQKLVFRFVGLYSPEKLGRIIERAHGYVWWKKNSSAAFMKAIGEINKEEKSGDEKQSVSK
jgi:hypothetical protein